MSQTNLIVNYLPSALEENDFKALFLEYGEIESYKLIRDKHTGKSLCYGFVNFSSADAAQAAINALNGSEYQGKKLKVGFARPSSDAIKHSNLYVANLPLSFTSADVQQVFAPYGTIIELNILKASLSDAAGEGRGVAFVRYDTREQALAAIAALNGRVIGSQDKPAIVRFAETPEEKRKRARTSVFMPGVGPVRSVMSPSQDLRFNPWLRPPVVPAAPTTAAAAAAAASQAAMAQGMLAYQMPFPTTPYQSPFALAPLAAPTPAMLPTAVPAAAGASPYCVFVYNLPAEADNNTLYRLFGPFGAVSDVKAIRDYTTSKCKGFGFVNFTRLEDAWAAIMALNGATIDGCARPLQVSFKTPKGSQPPQPQQQQQQQK